MSDKNVEAVETTVEAAADTVTDKKTTAVKDKRVDLFVPKGYVNDEPNLVISVNGKNYVLPKGKTSKVPPCVKYEYDRSLRAQQKQDENSEKMIAEAQAGK